MLKGKKILLGVSGGIAAYKTAYLVREFIKREAEVKVIMTPASLRFVTPLTLNTLSKNEVVTDFVDHRGGWNNHVDLALWADVMIIAPCTANTMAKMVDGTCDNVLMATYLSAKCKVLYAPAMDLDMYNHPSTCSNIGKLNSFGNIEIPAESGELASGLDGKGRMAEPETIIHFIEKELTSKDFHGDQVLVTAGPTYENIDPVRFIGNHSSGKMGVEIAEELAKRGAKVNLIIGPSSVITSSLVNRINVTSADDMNNEVTSLADKTDVFIMSAAVADFKPSIQENRKIKKEEGTPCIELTETPDILNGVGKNKRDDQLLIGFALETNNELENAKSKLRRKNLDLIVLNSLQDKGAGFKGDTNKVTLIDKKMNVNSFELKSKKEVARDIADKIVELKNI